MTATCRQRILGERLRSKINRDVTLEQASASCARIDRRLLARISLPSTPDYADDAESLRDGIIHVTMAVNSSVRSHFFSMTAGHAVEQGCTGNADPAERKMIRI